MSTARNIDLSFGFDESDPSVQALWDGVYCTVIDGTENQEGTFNVTADLYVYNYTPGMSPQTHSFDLVFELDGVAAPFQVSSSLGSDNVSVQPITFVCAANPFNASDFAGVNTSYQGMKINVSLTISKIAYSRLRMKLVGPVSVDGSFLGYMRVTIQPYLV